VLWAVDKTDFWHSSEYRDVCKKDFVVLKHRACRE